MVRFLVVTEELLESFGADEDFTAYKALKQREKRVECSRTALPLPSVGVSSIQGIHQVLVNHADKFHAGRPATIYGPPASLFNPYLGLLDHHLHLDEQCPELDPPPSLFQRVHTFMTIAAESYPPEFNQMKYSLSLLGNIFATGWGWDPFETITDETGDHNTPCIIVQVKNELGLGGDASLQAGLSYVHIVTAPRVKNLRKYFNCPSVLVGIMGDQLEIGVAVYTDGPYYTRLFSERLQLGFHVELNLLRVTRALMATRIAIYGLTQYYARFEGSPPGTRTLAHLFPSPLPVPSYDGFVPALPFTGRLSRSGQPFLLADDEAERQSGMYLAAMPRPTSTGEEAMSLDASVDHVEVVVKFTARYNEDAHRLLAKHHFAPKLHACIPVCGDLFMVVTERVHGEMAWEMQRRCELLPFCVYKDVRDAVALLYSNDLVFGDLRTPNAMVVPGRPGGLDRHGPRGVLLGFDCAGKHNLDRYPVSLDLDKGLPDWATSGVRRCGIMTKAEDLAMLEKLRRQCQSA